VQGVFEFVDREHDEHEGMDEASIREHEEVTKVKNVNFVRLGRHTIEAWYFSPFPQEYWKVSP
jgi:histone acetyltransferase MYST1